MDLINLINQNLFLFVIELFHQIRSHFVLRLFIQSRFFLRSEEMSYFMKVLLLHHFLLQYIGVVRPWFRQDFLVYFFVGFKGRAVDHLEFFLVKSLGTFHFLLDMVEIRARTWEVLLVFICKMFETFFIASKTVILLPIKLLFDIHLTLIELWLWIEFFIFLSIIKPFGSIAKTGFIFLFNDLILIFCRN